MVKEDKLSAVLSEFARTVITDFPIQQILDHLVERIVDLMPITAAGVTLISPGAAPHYIAASNPAAMRFEMLQTEIRDGPCLMAYDLGEPVAIADLRLDRRFPAFAPAAVAAGLLAVFTFPLRHGDGRLGALDLYRDAPGGLDPGDMKAAQTLADVAAAYVLNARARDEARAASDLFHHGALHDPLTGLPNRRLLRDRIDHAALRASRTHTYAAILFVDLDRFKQVNDTYGHQLGDTLLVNVALRLSGVVRAGDTLARFSGDEFVFLCEDLQSAAEVATLAERVTAALSEPFSVGGLEMTVTASVGVAFAGPGEHISNELIVRADMAMYQAKRDGGSGQFIEVRRAIERTQNLLETDLRRALAAGALDVAYQPIVRSCDGLVTGVEALLRWTDPDRGEVPPLSIVAVAERSGLISDLGLWVLERSCTDWRRWIDEWPDAALDLTVNVSARQLVHPHFVATVLGVLAKTGMNPMALILEMTESVFIEDSDRMSAVLHSLRDVGIRLALDDFGSGYSSLTYLSRVPIHIVKIDQHFVAGISTGANQTIIAAITNLAHGLGLTVVAEGVETESQDEQVRALGCDSAQGYYYARPMPAASFAAHLAALSLTNRLHLPLAVDLPQPS